MKHTEIPSKEDLQTSERNASVPEKEKALLGLTVTVTAVMRR